MPPPHPRSRRARHLACLALLHEQDRRPRFGTNALTSFELDRPRSPVAPEIRRALAAVDAVHPLVGLPVIPIRLRTGTRTVGGYNSGRGRPLFLEVSRRAPSVAFALLHEIGHELDHQLLGPRPGLWGSSRGTALRAWRRAVGATEAGARWRRERQSRYVCSARELWARSYAQHVAERAGDPVLAAAVGSPGVRPWQWEPEDFAPVAAALEAVLAKLPERREAGDAGPSLVRAAVRG